MAFVEHLPGFFVDFGESVVFGTSTKTAIFDDNYGEDYDASGSVPVLTCISSEIASVANNSAVTVRGVSYTVRGLEPDGSGITLVRLERD